MTAPNHVPDVEGTVKYRNVTEYASDIERIRQEQENVEQDGMYIPADARVLILSQISGENLVLDDEWTRGGIMTETRGIGAVLLRPTMSTGSMRMEDENRQHHLFDMALYQD